MNVTTTSTDSGERINEAEFKDGEIRIAELENADVPGVRLLVQVQFTARRVPAEIHFHPDLLEIGLCLRGRFTLWNEEGEHSVMPGYVFVNQPNVRHRLTTNPKGAFVYTLLIRLPTSQKNPALFGLSRTESLFLRDKLLALPLRIDTRGTAVSHYFRELFVQFDRNPSPVRSLWLRNLVIALVLQVIESPEVCTAHSETHSFGRISLVIEQMRAHPECPYAIERLAVQCGQSVSAFVLNFKRLTGFTPILFLIECRVEAAKKLLSNTRLSATEIAMRLGYCSPSFFSTQFRSVTGLSPKAWRDQSYT